MTGESEGSVAGAQHEGSVAGAQHEGSVAGWGEPHSPQPGGRIRAPGELALVQAFINSHYDLELEHGADLFATPAALGRWLARRHPLVAGTVADLTSADVRQAVAVREGLRALARTNAGDGGRTAESTLADLNAAVAGVAIEVRFARDGPRLVPAGDRALDQALGVVLGAAARAIIDGSWGRLKVCPGEDCGWAFYDHSRNQSGRWCSMSVCGGRAKARAHYRRRRGAARRDRED